MQTPIVSPAGLKELIAGGGGIVLLDCRPGGETFAAGHLPGAVHAELNRDLSAASEPDFDPRVGGRHPLPSLESWRRTLARWGIAPGTDVVAYDDQAGANAASRAWWMLRSVGHERVAVLDGGFQAAVEEGIPVTTQAPADAGLEPYPADRWQLPMVGIELVDELRSDPNARVLDVRSAERFRGEIELIDPVAGHVPGAVNLFYGRNLEHGRFKSPEALREQYETLLGRTPPHHLVVYCGSGVTACHTLAALEAAGIHGAALFIGSWSEWCRSDRPRG